MSSRVLSGYLLNSNAGNADNLAPYILTFRSRNSPELTGSQEEAEVLEVFFGCGFKSERER